MTIRSLSILLLFLFLAVGCGDLKTTSYFDKPKVKLNNYQAIEVADFESKLEDVNQGLLKELPDEVARLINSKRMDLKATRGAGSAPGDSTIVLLGEIIEYDSGSNMRFEGGALKFGESNLTLQLALVEKNTGNEITSGQVNSFSSLGFFRRGLVGKEVYEAMAEEIVRFVSENYRQN